uniref:EGF-like domain-containing protein n=1 Tax=Plectus sambesii TaxID=2011161 RepID=A0A914X3B5_9BILA
MVSFHVVALLSAYLLISCSLLASGDPCSNMPCQNGATCRTDNVTFSCKCATCFFGSFCEYNPCTEFGEPCENEGTCQYDSQTCTTTCHCKNGTFGILCEEHDPCASQPCRNGGTCNRLNDNSFHCQCPQCYNGQFCDRDPCADVGDFCGDHGHCIFNVSGVCQNSACECDHGWAGNNCQNQISTTAPPATTRTTPPIQCLSDPCQHGGTCTAAGSSYTCQCLTPYIGKNCESAICDPDPTKILNAVDGTWQTLSTTRYPLYISGLNCHWRIRAPIGHTIEIVVSSVTLVGSHNGNFEVGDPFADNPSLFSTHETSRTAINVTTSENLATVLFETHEGSSGNFFLQYQSVYTDPCDNYICNNGGTCHGNGNIPECQCHPCYSGFTCDIQKPNPCAGVTACGAHGHCEYNNATCSNPFCNCDAGYSQPFCT